MKFNGVRVELKLGPEGAESDAYIIAAILEDCYGKEPLKGSVVVY